MFTDFQKAYNDLEGSLYSFVEDDGYKLLGGELLEKDVEPTYDSYGNEDTTMTAVIDFPNYGCTVGFYGYSRSYDGTDWDRFEEVKKVEKQMWSWEPVYNQAESKQF